MGTETITYDKAGRIKEKANDLTGYSKSYSYYKDNTIREIKTRMDGNLVYYENFGYDKNGNKIYDDQNGDIRKYTYDGLNRLTGAEIGNVRTEYEFDSFNNISKEYEIIGGRVEKKSYYYDNANHLLLEDSDSRTVQYEYDNSGNLIKKITGIGSNAETSYYRYDGYNRLSEFIDNYSTAEYEYNINGLRESKTVNGTKTRYIYNQENIIGEIFDDNIYTYYRATELIGYKSNKGGRYYYRQNSHGDVTALLTVDGQEKKTYSYNAYGKENPLTLSPMGNQTVVQLWKTETEQVYNPFRYCGEYEDSETGLIYLRNRYYDNAIGRFITEDPIKDGLNWYVYCNNNPVMFVDSFGLEKVSIRDYVDKYNGEVYWDHTWGVAHFTINDNKFYVANLGYNDNGIEITNNDNRFYAEENDLNEIFFGITPADIEAGVEIVMFEEKPYIDITTPVTNALNRDVGDFKTNKGDNDYFASRVGNEGDWNLKYREADGKHWEETLGISFWGYQTQMLLNGKLVTVEQVGNITYGYLGAAADMSQTWMIIGSVGNHIWKHGIFGWGNELADQSLFGLGINWYNTGVME